MKSMLIKLFFLALMLLGLPLLGIMLTNKPITLYLEFPPRTFYVHHAPFSWLVFTCCGLFIIAVILPFIIHGIKAPSGKRVGPHHSFAFPWWAWLGIIFGIIAWVFAWNRFQWFARFQVHTFTPLWISYILTINALTYRRTGHCILLDRTPHLLLLFPLSALFWWFFEYLNRFVQNWYYLGPELDPLEYFLYATLPFSTVLPAVTGTRDYLLGLSWPEAKFQNFLPLKVFSPKLLAWVSLLAAGGGLAGIGVWPNYLFSLLWISPLLIIVSFQALFKEHHVFSDLLHGDWRFVLSSALAALICGFFWEMWNYYSLAKWNYSVPFVHRFQIFEMPLLGYAGYLPFGVECTVIANMILVRGKK